MKFTDALIIAFQNLWRTKFRTFLTILGVIIGISAIVLFVSLGVGLQKVTSDQVAGINALTTITVSQVPATQTMEEGPKITDETVDKIKKLSGVDSASPSVNIPANFFSGGTNAGGIAYGIDINNINLEVSAPSHGSLIKKGEDGAIISSALASAFSNNHENLIGQDLSVKILTDTSDLSTLGLAPKEINLKIAGIDNNETTNLVYMPMDKIYPLMKFDKYSSLKVKVNARKDIDPVKNEVQKMGFQVTTIKDLIDQIDKIFLLAQVILGLVGGIGLLVSSLGIINVMTMSLLERTHEIGIMKAIGASNKDIKKLFIIESGMIGFFGGVLGVGLAAGFGYGFNAILNYLVRASGQRLDIFSTPPKFALSMIAVAILISMFAGIYPTSRAQKLVPIDALREQ